MRLFAKRPPVSGAFVVLGSAALLLGALLFWVWAGGSFLAPGVTYLSSYTWRMEGQARHGGYSGLELSRDGTRFVALSDRPATSQGRLERTAGRITGVHADPPERLISDMGNYLDTLNGDTEGLAADARGGYFLSLEGRHAVNYLDGESRALIFVETGDLFAPLGTNTGLEALALAPDGYLLAIPEDWPREAGGFPVFRLDRFDHPGYPGDGGAGAGADGDPATAWSVAGEIARRGGFLPVGADTGPDGRLYVLERRFVPLLGFAAQVRRFDFGPRGALGETLLIRTRLGRHDNLEGLSVWEDAQGRLRLTMISDDNFSRFQKTEFVEYALE